MPRAHNNKVLCAHCHTYMTRLLEQQHHKLANSPFDAPQPGFVSQLQSVVESGSDDEDRVSSDDVAMETDLEGMDTLYDEAMDVDGKDAEDNNTAARHQDAFENHWGSNCRVTVESDDEHGSDSEDEMDVDEEGGNDGEWDEEYIDWAAIEAGSGLSAWDRLGESFENEAATIGKHTILDYTQVYVLTINLANRLAEYDLAICRAFAYKVETHTTDTAFKKLPYVFPQETPLPSLHGIRARAAFLSGFKPQIYDCCPNSCCCYAPPHLRDLTHCPTCNEPRYRADGKPRKTFSIFPQQGYGHKDGVQGQLQAQARCCRRCL